MPDVKQFLNRQANRQLGRLGYTGPMAAEAKREAWWWFKARERAIKSRSALVRGWGVVLTDNGWSELAPVEVALAGPGEVTVDVVSSTVSPGTERAQYLRLPNAKVKPPYRPGYSCAGRVRAIGDGVSEFEVGELVAVRGAPHTSVVTVAKKDVYKIPAGVSAEDAAMAGVAIVSSLGVRRASLVPGERYCVLGAGLIGILAQRLAAATGGGEATMVATSRQKEERAREGGVASFLVAGVDSDELESLEAPVVIEATGDPEAIHLAVQVAGVGGRIVLLGSPRGVTADLPVLEARSKELEILGAHVRALNEEELITGEDTYRREAGAFLNALATDDLEVADLIDAVVDPREVAKFHRRLATSNGMVSARFDWTRLAPPDSVSPRSLVSVPDLSARGTEPKPRRDRLGPLARFEDPFAGATGHMRIALVGCGDIAVQNAAAIAQAPNTSLVTCYDPNSDLAADLASSHGVTAARTLEEALESSDVDAVFLSVPHHLHSPLAIEAASHGRHVIVEKPPANSLQETVKMIDAARSNGVTLSFCFPQRYQSEVVLARRLIEADAIGAVGGAFVKLLMDRPAAYWKGGFSGRSISDWRGSRDKAGGGVFIMNLSHHVDLLRHLVGAEAESIIASIGAIDRRGEVEDTASVTIQFATGGIGTVLGCSSVRGTMSSELRLWGSNGHLQLEPDPRVYTLKAIEGLRTTRWHQIGDLPALPTRAIYVSRFATAVDQGRAPEITAEDGLRAQAFIEAVYRSAEERCSVEPAALLREAGA